MTPWMFCSIAAAQSAGTAGGFVSLPRTDAPTDGVVLYWADHLPQVTATDSGGAEQTLSTTYATGEGTDQLVAVTSPEGGWVAGETYTLSTLDPQVGPYPATLTFSVATDVADPPLAPTVDDVRMGDWTDGDPPTLTIEIDVTSADPDAWAWLDVVGLFALGSGISASDPAAHLAHAVGPGPHTLSFTQWQDEVEGPQPPCANVTPMSAAGLAGAPNQVCFAVDVGTPDHMSSDGGDCVCTSSTARPPWTALFAAAAFAARLRASRSPTGTTPGSSRCRRVRRTPAG